MHTIDIRGLTETREAIAFQDGGLFPVLAEAADGSISAVLRGGSGHLGRNGRIDFIRSRDGGRTWAPPAIIVDSEVDDRNPAYGVSSAGMLICAYYQQAGYTSEGKYEPKPGDTSVGMTRSHDHGLTWDVPVVIDTHGFPGSPFGRIVSLADGTILMSIYTTQDVEGYAAGAHLMRSHDDGLTWSAPELICAGRDETTLLVLPDGDLLAAMRKTERSVQSLATSLSADGGKTWSEPIEITGSFQHPADLIMLDDTNVLLTYGNRQPPYRIEGRISNDLGMTWRDELLLFSGQLYGYDLGDQRPTDFGYPSTVLLENGARGVMVYYVNPFSRARDRTWNGPETTPQYQPDGYRAICVTWSMAELRAVLSQ